jgi:hypothetical protein
MSDNTTNASGHQFTHWFTRISTLDCDESSSLPRFWWPFCRGRPKPWPRSGSGPRGCLEGRSSYALLNARWPPIGPGFSQEVICRKERGLLLCPKPALSCMRPISRSSISSLRWDMDPVVGVPFGFDELPLKPSPSRETPPGRPIGWLAVEGAGDGVYDRRSAYDLAPRRLGTAFRPPGESGNPKRPEVWRPKAL